jgi:hypothetical protein
MTMFFKISRIAAPLAFAALLGLAACSKDPAPEGTDEPTNYVEKTDGGDIPTDAKLVAPDPVKQLPPANVAVAAPDDQASREQQMQEDADASGMTSRMPPPEQTVATTNGEKVK